MSDSESPDGVVKSHVVKNTTNPASEPRMYNKDEEVRMGVDKKGIRETKMFKVQDHQWNENRNPPTWEYKLTLEEKAYSSKDGIVWFKEDDLAL